MQTRVTERRYFFGSTVWFIWLVTLQTCIARPADMIASCTIAYLKEFCIAFMLYFILILTYDANSVIFTFKMKPLMPWICHQNFPFKNSEEIWNMKRSTFRLPTRIWWHFIKEFFWPQKKQFKAPASKLRHQALWRIRGPDWKRPNQGRLAHGHHSRKRQVCQGLLYRRFEQYLHSESQLRPLL